MIMTAMPYPEDGSQESSPFSGSHNLSASFDVTWVLGGGGVTQRSHLGMNIQESFVVSTLASCF